MLYLGIFKRLFHGLRAFVSSKTTGRTPNQSKPPPICLPMTAKTDFDVLGLCGWRTASSKLLNYTTLFRSNAFSWVKSVCELKNHWTDPKSMQTHAHMSAHDSKDRFLWPGHLWTTQ